MTSIAVEPRWEESEIVPLQSDDLEQVLVIEGESYVRPWSRASFERELVLPFSRVLIARRSGDGVVLGYICRWRHAGVLEVLNLAVGLAFRRARIGRRLLGAVVDEACADGLTVRLEVQEDNAAAIALYQAVGFVAVGRRPHFYGRNRHAILMSVG